MSTANQNKLINNKQMKMLVKVACLIFIPDALAHVL